MSVHEHAPERGRLQMNGSEPPGRERAEPGSAEQEPAPRPDRPGKSPGDRLVEVVAIIATAVVLIAMMAFRPWQDPNAGSAPAPAEETAREADSAVEAAGGEAGEAEPAPPAPAAADPAPAADHDGHEGAQPPEQDTQASLDRQVPAVGTSYLAGIAAAVSQQIFPEGGAQELVLVRDQASGDALAAGSLIGLFDTTFLITGSDELPEVTAAEITRLGRPRVHILGGPGAISSEIEDQLLDAGHNVHRHFGPAQADTAVDIARAHFPDAWTAVLVRTPDRSAGPVAALSSALAATSMAAAQDMPMLLTNRDSLSGSTDELLQSSAIRRVIVVGNEDEIRPAVTARLDELGIEWQRWDGNDRFENAVEIARRRGFASPADAQVAVLVEGGHDSVWPAGFLGAVLGAREDGPVLLTEGDELPPVTAAYLRTGAGAATELICTPGVTQRACASAQGLLGAPAR